MSSSRASMQADGAGLLLADVPTPTLVLDEPKFAANLARMRTKLAAWPQVSLRPHMKTAKSLEAARRVTGGAGPITVSTLREAEQFAEGGYGDIVYAVGVTPDKLPRVAALGARGVRIRAILDSLDAAEAVAAFNATAAEPIAILIEVDADGKRGGVVADDPALVRIGAVLAAANALAGVLTHAGASYGARSADELKAFARLEHDAAVSAAERLREAGFACPIVSIGSTPTVLFTEDLSGVTEVRAGVYMFQDLVMAGAGVCLIGEIALSVAASVIGRQAGRNQVIIDAGWMALSRDRGTQAQRVDQGFGLVADIDGSPIDDLLVTSTSQEHGVISTRSGAQIDQSQFPLGRRLRILPNHACATAAQHDHYVVVRGDRVIDRWARFGQW